MKKLISRIQWSVVAIYILMIVLAICGCQPTPSSQIVQNKGADNNSVIEDSFPQQTGNHDLETPPTYQTDTTENIIEEHWSEDFTQRDITVHIDAKIEYPQRNSYQIYYAKSSAPSVEMVSRLASMIAPNSIMYEYDPNLWTKSRCKQQIEAIQERLNSATGLERQELQNYLQTLYEKHEQAPDYIESVPTSLSNYTDNGQIIFKLQEDNVDIAHVAADISSGELSFNLENIMYAGTSGISRDSHIASTRPEIDALAAAIHFINDLGIEDIGGGLISTVTSERLQENDLTDLSPLVDTYSVVLFPAYGGIPTYAFTAKSGSDSAIASVDSDGEYLVWAEPILQQEISLCVVDNTVVSLFIRGLCGPVSLTDDNIEILSVDQIKKIIGTEIFRHFYADEGQEVYICIEWMKLSMMKVAIKNSPGSFNIVPVWDIGGWFNPGNFNTDSEQGRELIQKYCFNSSFLTINAIDGTIINRQLGY